MSVVYLNGEFMPIATAKISVLDRGFLFGDGVYEIIPVFCGKIFREIEHLQRLEKSLEAISIQLAFGRQDWHELFVSLLDKNQVEQVGSIYLQVTRGVSEREHVYTDAAEATVFAMCKGINRRRFSDGVKAITHEDIRWDYCHIKAITLLPNVLLKQKAKNSGAFEAILLKDGRVIEGAASNVFVIKDNICKTPIKNTELLPGITRDVVLELARQADFTCDETDISTSELLAADEIWLTSSTLGIAPVIILDERPVGNGKPGKCWQQMIDIYDTFRHA